ncbi:type I restriction modification DNA specificity domain protein [Acinetobacter baumannii 1295549]|nr:restriction endonuclease subunit S [Acinetobacter baumannii]EXR19068.1 type I restriction modification DNA specificity domain protein [Acinetobacter baumannii 1295549]EXR90039.1 type I restriction modification DNA specificity domain protein [Acinetobacter baumannii 277047]EXS35635.1 type I restriction modification DNA specificity domain protein [Acinetobacter baumannii 426863]
MAALKLRFKDFDEDWTAKKLSQVANLTSSKRVHLSDYVSEGIPFFRGKEITELKSGIFPKDILYISKKQYEDFKEKFGAPQNNEILMTAVGTLANTYLINTDFEFYFKDGNLIWFKDINADPNFLMILLDARKNDVLASAIGSTQKALTIANLNKLIFNFPSNEEQTKIATFLSAVDEKISQLTQKHELLSQYKQGMMQKLFSQQIRFKADDGSEFGEWENKTLSKFIIKHIGGASLKPSDFVEQSEYEVIPKKAIVPNGYLNLDKDNPTYCSEDFFKANLKNTVDNTYLVTVLRDLVPSGPSIGYIVKYMENTQYILAQGVYGFKLKEELNKDFLIHFSNTKAYRLVMQSIMVGSTQVHIRNQDFFGIEIPVPCLAEQTKIANFLSAIDQKIEVVTQQIEQAKQWKKGLLQQMFV